MLIDLSQTISESNKLSIRIICEHPGTIRAITDNKSYSKITQECVSKLKEISKHKKTTIEQRMVETKYPNTDRVTSKTQPTIPGPSFKEISEAIKTWSIIQHNNEYNNSTVGRATKENIPNPYSKKLDNICNLSREHIRYLTHILTGHAWLNKHLHTIKRSETPTCPLCQSENETVNHFIYECTSLDEERERVFGPTKISPEHNPIKEMEHKLIIAFCKISKRFDREEDPLQN